jgi:hypothetical protein
VKQDDGRVMIGMWIRMDKEIIWETLHLKYPQQPSIISFVSIKLLLLVLPHVINHERYAQFCTGYEGMRTKKTPFLNQGWGEEW